MLLMEEVSGSALVRKRWTGNVICIRTFDNNVLESERNWPHRQKLVLTSTVRRLESWRRSGLGVYVCLRFYVCLYCTMVIVVLRQADPHLRVFNKCLRSIHCVRS